MVSPLRGREGGKANGMDAACSLVRESFGRKLPSDEISFTTRATLIFANHAKEDVKGCTKGNRLRLQYLWCA